MIILDQEVPLKENLLYAIDNHKFLWGLLIISAVFDYFTTYLFMTRGGVDLEANLIIRYLAHSMGIIVGVGLGKILQLGAAMAFCALNKEMSKGVLLIILALNCFAITVNTIY
ncbi:hypothetical protein FE810_07825 [Thalassotalea litorea]|uniref:DUF5658 domain-containing protein n=1 Tax=Thalassotalea litorea TaxID=2020715 RepID=A0A5R9IKL1_9GAMM|nr:hypothetical protein [Thalassotalea litorea]TLU65812.1 hypothetical protein FE810_07825 [Thalassotalea litorea]